MIKTGSGTPPPKGTGTPWPSKILKLDQASNNWKNQPTPQSEKCACGALLVKEPGTDAPYCPDCKSKEAKS